ncbi:MAG: hypothetical protein ACRDHF_00105 [Tepidiformaceae bacterium]
MAFRGEPGLPANAAPNRAERPVFGALRVCRAAAFLVAGGIVLLVFGCNDNGGSESDVALDQAVDRTIAAGSVDFRWAWSIGPAVVITAEGQADFSTERGSLEMVFSQNRPSSTVGQLILVEGALFSREADPDGHWTEWTGRVGGASGFLGLRDGIPEFPPLEETLTTDGFRESLEGLLGDTEAYEHRGQSTLEGQRFEHFQLRAPPSNPIPIRATDAYLDSQGRLRRLEYPVPDPVDRGVPLHVVLEFVAFGTVKEEITAPLVP